MWIKFNKCLSLKAQSARVSLRLPIKDCWVDKNAIHKQHVSYFAASLAYLSPVYSNFLLKNKSTQKHAMLTSKVKPTL